MSPHSTQQKEPMKTDDFWLFLFKYSTCILLTYLQYLLRSCGVFTPPNKAQQYMRIVAIQYIVFVTTKWSTYNPEIVWFNTGSCKFSQLCIIQSRIRPQFLKKAVQNVSTFVENHLSEIIGRYTLKNSENKKWWKKYFFPDAFYTVFTNTFIWFLKQINLEI